jgi:hypothetical protein
MAGARSAAIVVATATGSEREIIECFPSCTLVLAVLIKGGSNLGSDG